MSLPDIIPIDVLFADPERSAPQITPDGRRVLYLAPRDGVLNIWAITLGEDDAAPLTHDRKRGIHSFTVAPNGTHVLFVQDSAGDENWHLHTLDLDTGESVDRTPVPGAQATIVATSPRRPDEVLVGLNSRDPRYHDLHRLHLGSGALTLEVENPGFESWVVDNDLVVRGGSRPRSDGGYDYAFRPSEGTSDDPAAWPVRFSVDPDDFVINVTYPISFTGDNQRLLLTSTDASDTARLVELDPETGIRRVIAEDPEYDLYGIDLPGLKPIVLHPDTRDPQLVTWYAARARYGVLDPSIAEHVDRICAAAQGDIVVESRDRDCRRWVVTDIVDAGSAKVLLYDTESRRVTELFSTRPNLERRELANMEPFTFTSRDGLKVHAYATFPPGVDRRRLPAVIHVHGGPWGGRHFWKYAAENQWLANRGYVCLEIDYRGSGGYGKSFLNASRREWAGRMHDDLLDGLAHAVEAGWVDRDRVAIFGGSYGGYAALVGATFTPDVFRCAIDYVGPSNLITLLESIPPYWFGVAKQFDKLLGNPERDRDFLWQRSPLSRVADIRIPLLIAQGANDPRVKQAESDQIVAELRARGVEHEYLLFEDEGHGFVRPENRATFFKAADRFLARHLGGRSEE